MENPFNKYFQNSENEPKPEAKESITVGRLNELNEKIIQIAPSDFNDIYSDKFLESIGSIFEEFTQAESGLDSNTKTKLYRKIKEESFAPKIKETADLLDTELKELDIVAGRIMDAGVSDSEKEIYESYLDIPAWQRVSKIEKLISVLEKAGFDGKELKEKISEINKIIEKQEYREAEGRIGKYE